MSFHKMKIPLIKKSPYILLMLIASVRVSAQSKEDKTLFQKFALICNSYKQIPLQLSLQTSKKTNWLTTPEDTAVIQGTFFIDKDNAYIKYGTVEQIVTDSFALMVMNDIKQMVYSEETIDINARLAGMMNTSVSNQTVTKMAELYLITESVNNDHVLKLQTRKKIAGSELPVEELTLSYNSKNEPLVIENLVRKLIRKPESADIPSGITIVTISDRGNYIVKEDKTAYTYQKIEHATDRKIPVQLSERVEKNVSNNYVPVRKYEQYDLKFN